MERHSFFRDEICTCLNIEVDLQVIDRSLFSLDHFILKQKTNQDFIKKFKGWYILSILKGDISPSTSLIMLIVRKKFEENL